MLVQVCLELLTFIFLAQIFKMLYQLSLSFNLAKKDKYRKNISQCLFGSDETRAVPLIIRVWPWTPDQWPDVHILRRLTRRRRGVSMTMVTRALLRRGDGASHTGMALVGHLLPCE